MNQRFVRKNVAISGEHHEDQCGKVYEEGTMWVGKGRYQPDAYLDQLPRFCKAWSASVRVKIGKVYGGNAALGLSEPHWIVWAGGATIYRAVVHTSGGVELGSSSIGTVLVDK